MAGIYVHIPFCKQKCTYCDFASYPREIGKADIYFACLYQEMKGKAILTDKITFDTIYFGGGTPSFVDPKYILGAVRRLRERYKISENAEITLEVNPGTIDEEKLKVYKECGFNRFSVGLQSADDEMLKKLNRIHTKEDFLRAAQLLKGFNLSVDVMIGLENQKENNVKDSIDLAVEGGAKHISMYALTPEEGTPMYGNYLNGDLPSEDEVADLYDYGRNYLKSLGFMRYEVSNFAIPGYESRHNINYWRRGQYIGLGVAASSFIGERRFTNTEKIDEYVHCILNNKTAEVFSEEIDFAGQKEEYVMLALRTVAGINLEDYKKTFGTDFTQDYADKLNRQRKYLDITENSIAIKDEFLFVQNSIISEII